MDDRLTRVVGAKSLQLSEQAVSRRHQLIAVAGERVDAGERLVDVCQHLHGLWYDRCQHLPGSVKRGGSAGQRPAPERTTARLKQ